MDWEERWAAPRIHGRAKRQIEAMFQEEKPYLTALPLESFRYFKEETRTVQDDRTMQVNDLWDAARPARIGSEAIVRIFERELEIRDMTTMALLRRRPLAYKKGCFSPHGERERGITCIARNASLRHIDASPSLLYSPPSMRTSVFGSDCPGVSFVHSHCKKSSGCMRPRRRALAAGPVGLRHRSIHTAARRRANRSRRRHRAPAD